MVECIDEETRQELLRLIKDDRAKNIINSIQICRRKTKRAPSKYNVFMGSCVKGKTGAIKDRFRSCVSEWKMKK